MSPMPACRCVLLDIVAKRPCQPQRDRRGRRRENAQDRAGALHVARRGQAGDDRQYRGRPRQARRMRLDHRGRGGAARREAGALRGASRSRAQGRHGVVSSNTSTIPHRRAGRRACRSASRATSSSPISSTRRAICGCWKWWRARRAIPTAVARISRFRRCDARQEHRDLQGLAGLHRQPARRLLDAARRCWRRSIWA